ncbi:MAG: Mpo1-like protein [Chlamydiota bacterium]
MPSLYAKWAARHMNRINLVLHAVGIPLTVAAIPALLFRDPRLTAGLFVCGYALQFVGHAIEGNKSGEQMLCEKLIRRR